VIPFSGVLILVSGLTILILERLGIKHEPDWIRTWRLIALCIMGARFGSLFFDFQPDHVFVEAVYLNLALALTACAANRVFTAFVAPGNGVAHDET
jgi:uncharacterized membrane protein YfcA